MSRRLSQRAASARRMAIADEAARLMMEHGIVDYGLAKRKAATNIGEPLHGNHLPTNQEIDSARLLRQSLYVPNASTRLDQLRQVGLRVMSFLEPLASAMTGDVLRGLVTTESRLEFHVFCQTPEEVALHLIEKRQPYESGTRKIRFYDHDEHLTAYTFFFGDVLVTLTAFPDGGRQVPLSPFDGQPYLRADRRSLLQLLDKSRER